MPTTSAQALDTAQVQLLAASRHHRQDKLVNSMDWQKLSKRCASIESSLMTSAVGLATQKKLQGTY